MTTRDWRSLVIQADPTWPLKSVQMDTLTIDGVVGRDEMGNRVANPGGRAVGRRLFRERVAFGEPYDWNND